MSDREWQTLLLYWFRLPVFIERNDGVHIVLHWLVWVSHLIIFTIVPILLMLTVSATIVTFVAWICSYPFPVLTDLTGEIVVFIVVLLVLAVASIYDRFASSVLKIHTI